MVGTSLKAVFHLGLVKIYSIPEREGIGVVKLRGLAIHPSEPDLGSVSSTT